MCMHKKRMHHYLPGIHFYNKHRYCNTFGASQIQCHDFDNGDAFSFKDKYTALLQQELQNPYWCLHDPIVTKSYQILTDIDIEMMPPAMYFTGKPEMVTKINHVPYQTISYTDKGMFPAQLMDNTLIQVFIMLQHLPFSQLALTTNIPFYKNT